MARPYILQKDQGQIPVAQYENLAGTGSEPVKGEDGAYYVNVRKEPRRTAQAFEQLTVADTITALTSATYAGTRFAVVEIRDAAISFRIDGGNPTSTVGHIATDGTLIELTSLSDITNFKAIRTTATSATIAITYSN